MSIPEDPPDKRFSLARWSARKREAARGGAVREPAAARDVDPGPALATMPLQAPRAATAGDVADVREAQPLPDVDSLTFDSDFTAFMAKDVDADIKRAALRKLLRDPRFNVMDGLDVYIDDYTREDPIPPSMLARLEHAVAVLSPAAAPAGAPRDAGDGTHDAGDDVCDAGASTGPAPIATRAAEQAATPPPSPAVGAPATVARDTGADPGGGRRDGVAQAPSSREP
jgi:hypothetical protein